MPIVNSMLGVTEQVPVPEGQPASAAVYHSRIFGAGVNAKDNGVDKGNDALYTCHKA